MKDESKAGTPSLGIGRWLSVLFAVLSGLYLLIGGVWLVAIGGSPYYIVAAIILLVVAWLIYRGTGLALLLYALLLIGTVIWAVFEAGFDFWALAPRIDILVLFGIWLLLPFVYRRLDASARRGAAALAVCLVLTGIALAYAAFNDPQELNGKVSQNSGVSPTQPDSHPGDWTAYGRTQAGTRYSPLAQINQDNAKDLQVAWTFQTGDKKGPNDPVEITNEVTPLKVGALLYLCSPHQILFALDAATGKEKWRFDPGLKLSLIHI